MGIGKYEKAIQDFEKGLEFDKYDSDFLRNLARAYAYLEDYDKALSYIKTAIQAKSSDYFLLGVRAEILLKAGLIEEGVDEIKNFLLKSTPHNKPYDYAYANVLQAIASLYEKDEEAARAFLIEAFSYGNSGVESYEVWIEFQKMDIDLKTKIINMIKEVKETKNETSNEHRNRV